jgi:hypothetical protein
VGGGELTKFSADDALLLLVSCQDPRHKFGCGHGACPFLSSEPVGMSHNQFPPHQQGHEWSEIDPEGQALEFVQRFQELCSLWVSLFVYHQLMCDWF